MAVDVVFWEDLGHRRIQKTVDRFRWKWGRGTYQKRKKQPENKTEAGVREKREDNLREESGEHGAEWRVQGVGRVWRGCPTAGRD